MRRSRALASALCGTVAIVVTGLIGAAPASALADGVAASSGQFPFAVKLVMTNIPNSTGGTYNSGCSGALISATWIITAGHCFHDVNRNPVSGAVPYPTTATFNTATTNPAQSGAVTLSVDTVQQSPTADVAVAHMVGSTTVAPLHLATTSPTRGAIVTMAGWGATSDVNPAPSNQLYWGRMKVSRYSSSTVSVTGYYPYRDTSACLYDSGAPYFLTPSGAAPRLVSTESNGPNCPHTSAETTARVDNQLSWIRTVVTDLPAQS